MAILSLGILIYLLLLLSEQALANLSPSELESLRAKPERAAQRAVKLADQLRSSLAALLLGRILTGLVLGLYTGVWVLHHGGIRASLYQFSENNHLPGWLVWGVVALLLSLLIAFMLWGLDKNALLNRKSVRTPFWLQRLSLFITVCRGLFTPFIRKEKKAETGHEHAISSASDKPDESTSEKRELELLKSIVEFGDVTIKQVMQPRSKVVAVDFKTAFPELLQTVREAEFSRLPVIDEDLDNITGILYVKDLVPHLDKPADFEWQGLIRANVMLVPESKRGSELLQEFKEQKMHMAIVVDEYGGSAGIVTLEDILEEVTGDIRDEFDEESEIRFRKLDEFNYLFEGQTLLNDVCRIAGLPTNVFDTLRGNSDTLAGLALEMRGDIPGIGEEIACGNYLLTITAADSRRIEQVKLGLPKS